MVAMNNPKLRRFAPIFIGLGITGIVLVLMFEFINGRSKAGDFAPQEVVVSNITQNSASISWTTDQPTQCVVDYNSSITAVSTGSFAPEPEKTQKHKIDITLLAPTTTYYYEFSCNGQTYDNNGTPYSFETISADKKAPSLTTTPQLPPVNTSQAPTPTTAAVATPASGCSYTDCPSIKNHLGQGCTMRDYLIKCISTSPTPTLQPAPKYQSPTPTGTI